MADVMSRPLSRPISAPMSPGNASKMVELYGDDGTAPDKPMSRPLSRPISKPKEGFIENVGRVAGGAVENIGKAISRPLSPGNLLEKTGEVGSRVAGAAGDMFTAATAVPQAGVSQLAKKTGAAEKLGTYVAGKVGANPEQAKEIGKKSEASTADVIGGSVVNATAAALPGAKGTKAIADALPVVKRREIAPGVKSAEEIHAPAIRAKDGQIYMGKDHAGIRASNPELTKGGEEGFVTNTKEFIGRKDAMDVAKNAGQVGVDTKKPKDLHSEDLTPSKSQIFSRDQPIASTQNVSTVKGVADKLFQSRGEIRADYKEFSQWANQFKDVPKDFWQKAYDHLDDPKGTPLSPQEKIIFDRSVGVMRDEIDAARKEIKAAGLDPNMLEEGLGGAIRQRKGMNTPMDRMTGTKSVARPPEGGRSLSKSAGTFKGRNMMSLTQDGKRQVVHIDDDGNIFDASKKGDPIGKVDESTGEPKLADGKTAKLGEATRKEIEAATKGEIAYHDNAFGVYGTTLLQVRRAMRSVRILDEIKKSPDFNAIARGPNVKSVDIPKSWKEIPNAPEFRGYRFDPRYAEEIEDFIHGANFDAGELGKLDRINRFALNTAFWANPYHAFNMNNAFLVTKGMGGLARDLPGTTADLLKSIKSVATRDKFNMEQARSGVPMRGLDHAGEDFQKKTLDIMGVKMRQDPQNFAQFAKRYGFDSPRDFYSYISKMSHKATFAWQDVLQQTLERGLMRKGMSRAQATEKLAKTFMNYRTPARVADQRWMGKALQGQAWLNFPKYAYGRLNGMYNILKDASKLDPHALDQLMTIGVLYEFGQHAINPLLQEITGNPNATLSEFGYEVFPELLHKLYSGDRTPGQVAQSLASPGYGLQAIDTARGVQAYTGKPISIPGEGPGEVAMDYLSHFADKFSPVQKYHQMQRGDVDSGDLMLEQLGVKYPIDPSEMKTIRRQLKTREKYGSKIEQDLR